MEQMSKKELADALCQALFGDDGKYINNDTAGFCDRLGYFQGTGEEYDEPMQVTVYDDELMIKWIDDDPGTMSDDEMAGFVRGIVYAIDRRWVEDDSDSKNVRFIPSE